jgi:hypothetical protein
MGEGERERREEQKKQTHLSVPDKLIPFAQAHIDPDPESATRLGSIERDEGDGAQRRRGECE